MVIVLSIIDIVLKGFDVTLLTIGLVAEPGEDGATGALRDITYILYYVVQSGRSKQYTTCS